MYLTSISLRNYRNYEDSFFSFYPKGCLITGKNGVGKTNLLEAVAYFTYGRSILNQPDHLLINTSKDDFFLKSEFSLNGKENRHTEFQTYYNKFKKKLIHINNKPLSRISDLYQYIQVIYSGPDDVYNIFSQPAKRRFFLDMAISKVFPGYLFCLRSFKDALLQRNSLLKRSFSKAEKESWDNTYCQASIKVTEFRTRFIELYSKDLKEAYEMFSQNKENVNIYLKTNEVSMDTLKDNEEKEKKYLTSLFGSHLDDFYLTLNGRFAQNYSSQGQKRSVVIAMKIALSSMITSVNKVNPIMIFDDTLAELDVNRSTALLNRLAADHQVFIASPSLEKYSNIDLPVQEL
ncbi:MAG: DNA replication and repair protein RecF [Candidatus Cloacimonetes bacterium]|nr:DNA replication and repair protein RecF [Candidatus Cloacimonadota bacterium]